MSIEIRVPTLGESVTEATVGKWFKKAGEAVKADEPLVELETDKVTVEVPAPASGVMGEIIVAQGATVAVGSLLAALLEGGAAPAKAAVATAPAAAPAKPAPAAAAAPTAMPPSPAARKALAESGLAATDVAGSGKRGQVLKSDVAAAPAIAPVAAVPEVVAVPVTPLKPAPAPSSLALRDVRLPAADNDANREERVKMTRLRQTIARRLKDAQNSAAMLTTFNDVDMSAVMALRSQYKDIFEKRHGVKLGFMGLFVKACIQALRDIPAVNAEI
ncbi:MAG: biotin/lipoyl-containing protein, partial [Hyphomicrobium sp.]